MWVNLSTVRWSSSSNIRINSSQSSFMIAAECPESVICHYIVTSAMQLTDPQPLFLFLLSFMVCYHNLLCNIDDYDSTYCICDWYVSLCNSRLQKSDNISNHVLFTCLEMSNGIIYNLTTGSMDDSFNCCVYADMYSICRIKLWCYLPCLIDDFQWVSDISVYC